MQTVINNADAEEERARDDTVRQHLEDSALHALNVGGEDTHRDVTHVGNRRVGNQLLDVVLHHRHQRGVDDGENRQRKDERCEIVRRQREHRQREADETVTAELQHDASQNDRTCGRGLNVGIRQPGVHRPHRHLDREGGKTGEPQPGLHAGREAVFQQFRHIGRAGLPVHGHDREHGQDRAEQRVEEELVGGVNAILAAPHADDDEHRDQRRFEEDVEENGIQRHEDADHDNFQQQEGDHVFLDALLDRIPACQHTERHEESGEDNEEHGDAIDAEMIGGDVAEPFMLLDHLEAGVRIVETDPDEQRHDESENGRQQRDIENVAATIGAVLIRQKQEHHADERQKGDR